MQANVRFVAPPDRDQIRKIASANFLELSELEVEYIEAMIHESLPVYRQIDRIPDPREDLEYTDRDPGYRPDTTEDPFNAFATKCAVRGATDGPLAGYTVGLKDNISVAGVETSMGSPMMNGYVPRRDATVVTRLLEAGADITGKLTMTPFSVGDNFHDQGRNPHDPTRTAGASSTGSAIAVVTGDVDVALGADQGGSIRQPSAWCGCVGLKPTRGLVPYTGVQSLDDTLDYVGPMTRTVEDCALTLEAISGFDPLDHRSREASKPGSYADAIGRDVDDLTIGVLAEGFETEGADEDVHEVVRASIDTLEELGATVTEVSVPWHVDGAALAVAILTEGFAMKIANDGITPFTQGFHDVGFAEAFGKARRVRGGDLSLRIKLKLVFGQYLAEEYQHRYYGRAQNLARELIAAYDDALVDVDLLALPTWDQVAPELLECETYEEAVEATRESWTNKHSSTTSQFDVSGHPALSVPCGTVDGLPVGLQLIGEHFREDVLFQAADAFEQHVDWAA